MHFWSLQDKMVVDRATLQQLLDAADRANRALAHAADLFMKAATAVEDPSLAFASFHSAACRSLQCEFVFQACDTHSLAC